jgi:spore maturation protein CgeB
MSERFDVVVLGLSLSSSWGNGHATTWRSLIKGLDRRGHRVLFLEREQDWYAAHRDLQSFPHCTLRFYKDLARLQIEHSQVVRDAAAVLIGSYVPEGREVIRWVNATACGMRAFYDIDTPVTLAQVARGDCTYLSRDQIRTFDLYLSFAGGPTLTRLREDFGARQVSPLYCSVDAESYQPLPVKLDFDLGYLGTYSPDRQPGLESFLLAPARELPAQSFSVVGAQYPPHLQWPANVEHRAHLPPRAHPAYYSSQRFTLNLTRADMVAAGYSPSVRLFEAGACGVPVISDSWAGMEEFFTPDREVLVASSSEQIVDWLRVMPEYERRRIARAARERVLAQHTAECRARELEGHLRIARGRRGRRVPPLAMGLAPLRISE